MSEAQAAPKVYSSVVTSENLTEFNLSRLRIAPEKHAEAAPETKDDKVEEKSAKQDESDKDSDDGDDDAADHSKPKHKNGIQKRFSELTGARNEAQRQAAEAKAEADALRGRIEALEKASKPAEKVDANAKPKADDFKDPFEYAEALSEWKVGQKLAERDERDRKAKADAESAARTKDWERRVKETTKEIDDYEEVMSEANFPLTHELAVAMLESDIGPRIQYYLAKNPDELAALKDMTIGKMLRSFGKLEAKLEREGEAKKADAAPIKAAVKRAAPEPITPIQSSGVSDSALVGANGEINGSFQQYRAARKAGKIK